jgi:hypothetical protein
MSQLLIQNRGEAPVESFTLLGASLSRNENNLLGKFGSGAKFAITTLLRRGLKVTVYTGLTRLEFKTRVIEIDDGLEVKQERQVYIQFGGTSKKRQDLGWVLSMGEMDWGIDIDMALREFVSNAIDRTVKQGDNVREAYTDGDLIVRIVPDDAQRAQKGYTRVFIEADEACQTYVDELPMRFLHFSGANLGRALMPKLGDRRKAQIYYNGVWVRELAAFEDSLFDYNFSEGQITIDESRNLDDYNTRAAVAKLFRDAGEGDLVRLFRALQQGTTSLETGLDAFYMKPNSYDGATEKQKEAWKAAWEEVNGDSVACGRDQGVVGDFARRKGHNLAVIDEPSMLETVKEYGIPGVGDVLSDNERKGRTITAPTFEAIDAVTTVWEWVTATDLIDEEKCPKPKVRGFDEISNAESDCLGFYTPGTTEVHIRNDLGGDILLETALEEVAHYVTGATDCSRDFQNFLLRLFIRWMK